MNIKKLSQACDSFAKLAQQLNKKRVDPAKKKEIELWANTLVSGFQGTGTFLPSLPAAKKVFDSIAQYRKSPAYGETENLKVVESLLTAITYSTDKLRGLGVDPIAILKQKGSAPNINAEFLEAIKTNLETLRDGVNFSTYRDYFIPALTKPGQMIELDAPDIELGNTVAGPVKPEEAGY